MKKITLIFSLLVFVLAGCSDFLDVNENPNFPTEVEDYLILPAAQASVASVMSADYGLVGGFWSQHWAQNNTSSQYKTFETYTLSSNSGRVDGSYREMYIGGLADNEIMHLNALEDENWSLYLMTSVLKAYGFQYLVDLYGNVPYDEAFMGDDGLFNPVVNTGEEVYSRIYTLLNTALAKDFSGLDDVDVRYEDYDLLLGGNLQDWINFANSMKLRILLRQVEANSTWALAELTTLVANGTFLTKDVSLTNFEDVDSKSNPLYEADQRQLNTSNNIRANATLTVYLKSMGDARIDALFTQVGGTRTGMITGTYELPSTVWNAPDLIAQPILDPVMPVHLMTYAESELLLAEAYYRLGNAAMAQSHYEAGVAASFARMGASSAGMLGAGEPYAYGEAHAQLNQRINEAGDPVANGNTDVADPLRDIIMAKWVDAADGQRGIESFIEQVRTGYPAIASAAVQSGSPAGKEDDLDAAYIPGTLIYSKKGASGGQFPQRLPYADGELNYNSNAAAYKNLADMEVMLSNVWWKQ